MAKKTHTEEATAPVDQTEAPPAETPNGDAVPKKKKPRNKAEAFRRLGNKRLPKLLKAGAALLALSNRNSYQFTEEQATKIRSVVAAMAADIDRAFSTNDTKEVAAESFF